MALTVGQTIALACEASHSPRKTQQALYFYNSILSDLCQQRDFAEARGQFLFNLTTTRQPGTGGGGGGGSGGGTFDPGGGSTFDPGGGAVLDTGGGGSGGGGSVSFDPGGGGFDPGGGSTFDPGGGGATPPIPPTPIPPQIPGGGLPYPGNQFGSGPILMPLDYLRLSGSSGSSGAQRSFIWWLDGVPYPVIPMDLAEFDMQVQQTGLQSFVWLSATDMSAPIDDRILLKTTANTTAGSTALTNLGSVARLVANGVLGVAGQGIIPGTTLIGGTTSGGGGGIDTGGGSIFDPGGGAIPDPGGISLSTVTLTLSQPANATIQGASIFFGYPPVIYIYPPPSAALQAMIRYQKQMPDVVDTTRIPWFRNDSYMLDALIGKMCRLNDDSRADQLLGGPNVVGSAENKLSLFLAMKDDEQSHPKRVELDRRYFGRGIGHLKNTKRVGW